ncbi:hypothetical protein [Variovorax saccharolyticus]|uniref:hypothetical protein n=1 Tax=Variovorax saccharolyticus TaxID=3053516 RepID=UPI002574C036|nr:hypothetical protein [Variovorax sp. J22R187]MDM0018180.1 hypothetical protein [Variovorax sp. J22R187]
MPAVYGSATINNIASLGNALPVQDMIGTTPELRANAGGNMQNGHVGAAEDVVVTPPSAAALIAAQDTPAIDSNSDPLTWDIPTGTWGPNP